MITAQHLVHGQPSAGTELLESEARLRLALSASRQGMFDLDLKSGTAIFSAECALILGYSPEEFHDSVDAWQARIHPDDVKRSRQTYDDFISGRIPEYRVECRQKSKTGEWRWILSVGNIVERDAQGTPSRMLGIRTDITEQKTTQERLRQLSLAVEQSPESIVITDLAGKIEYVNTAFTTTTGFALQEVIGKNPRVLQSGKTPPETYESMWQTLLAGNAWQGELFNRRKDGSEYVELARIAPIRQPDGRISHYLAVKEDITERRRAIRRSQAQIELGALGGTLSEADFLRRGIDLAEDVTDSTVAFLHVVGGNERSVEFSAWSSRVLRSHPQASSNFSPICRNGELSEAFRLKRPAILNDCTPYAGDSQDGGVSLQRMTVVPIFDHERLRIILGVGNRSGSYGDSDVESLQLIGSSIWRIIDGERTNRELAENLHRQRELNQKLEQAQNQLLQSEKMSSLGQLAAGVAHELNNPIGFVNSNLGSLDSYLADIFSIISAYEEVEKRGSPDANTFADVNAVRREKDYEFLKTDIVQLMAESRAGLVRVAKIVRDLKDFSRAGEAEWQWADLHQGIESTLNIVRNELKYKCEVKTEYGELPAVWCIPSQLNQVFMNLFVNAAQSIPKKGNITIRTGRKGALAYVAVSDSGIGIAPDDLARIFEPFFTTKPVGQGTGLGLSLSWSIVQKHQGKIDVQSKPGHGSTFTVWLPIEPAPIVK